MALKNFYVTELPTCEFCVTDKATYHMPDNVACRWMKLCTGCKCKIGNRIGVGRRLIVGDISKNKSSSLNEIEKGVRDVEYL